MSPSHTESSLNQPSSVWGSCLSDETRDEGVEKLLVGIDPGKASGPAEILCGTHKELVNELAPILCCMFHQSFNIGELPSTWLKA